MPAIVTESLGKAYGGHGTPLHRSGEVRALRDLSISVETGEIFGFLGPNGAGKSTFIRLLLGYLHPTEGGGQVLGRDITTDSEEDPAPHRLSARWHRPLRHHERSRATRLSLCLGRTSFAAAR